MARRARLAGGCWGFAATDDLFARGNRAGRRAAVEIAHASALARKKDVESRRAEVRSGVVSPYAVDPFRPVEENLACAGD